MSVFCALDATGEASLDGVLAAMRSYHVVHLVTVAASRAAGFDLLATATRPHFTLVGRDGGSLDVVRLLDTLCEA